MNFRETKIAIVKQNPAVIWFSGLSGAGKTTLANMACANFLEKGHLTTILDGDELRKGLNSNLGFSEEDRLENMRLTAEMASILAATGVVTIVSLISPLEKGRQLAREIIGMGNFYEVYINCPIHVLEKRDTKGFYRQAAEGKFKGLTGIDARFDIPVNADLELRTDLLSAEECTRKLVDFVLPKIALT